YMSGLEVRYAPYGNEPVNVHLGAKEITWKTLSKWMRWSEHESKRRLKEVEDFSIAMLNASNKAIKKLDPKNNGGYYGMDCIWGKKGLYAMETNSGPGGIDYQLETATNEEDKIEALKPLFGRMARLAKKYRTKVRKLPADPDKWIIVKQTYKNFLSLSDMQKTNKDHIESARYFGKALEEGSSKDPFFWRLYGHKLIGLNDDKNALKAFRRAADLNPLDHDSYICLAETYIMLKNPKKALKATKRAMEINPISHFDRVVRAGALFAGGKDELAEESLKTARKLVAKEPKEAKEKFDNNLSRILSLVAMYFYEKKQYQRSHDFALRALKTIPDHKEVMARIKQYKPSRHINYFTFLRSISSSYNKYNYIKALIYLAVSNAALKKYKDSQKNYWLFLANNPNNIDMWINFAKTFEAQGDHEGAYMIIREAWRENPNTKKFWLHSGYYLSLMGRHDEAVISFMQGFSKISNLELLKPFLPRYVAEMRLSGQIQEAIATLEKFTRKYPDDISVWYQLALCYRHSGEFDALDDTAIQMMALDPDNPWGYIFKSHALIGRERMGEAYFYAGKVLSLESTLLDKRKRIYYDLANTLLQLGKLETAGLYYKTYCRLNKNDADALHRYIIVLSNLNDTKEALKFARRLMKIAPEDPRGWLHLAVHYWYNGKKRKAFEYFEKSFSLDPDKTLTKKFFHRYYASIPKKLLKNYLPIKRVLAKYIGIKTTMVPSPDTDIFLMLADTAGLIVRPPEKAQKQVDEDSVLLAERSL
ncbi:tetratricopeptide repeat protein, partial [Candidatus Auribacterota bacterium]